LLHHNVDTTTAADIATQIQLVHDYEAYDAQHVQEQPYSKPLSFKDLVLSYPGRDLPALDELNIELTKGVIHALTGESGSGMSSLVKVVADLVQPQSGVMTLWKGKKAAYVSQDLLLFSRSVRENVSYGKKDVTDEAIWSALEHAHIAPFVRMLPNQLNQVLDENMVSGGQLQRMHLAHLFCTGNDADLIMLDECLSALDEKSRDILIEHLGEFLKGKTAIIITQHSEMLLICDKVHDLSKANHGVHM